MAERASVTRKAAKKAGAGGAGGAKRRTSERGAGRADAPKAARNEATTAAKKDTKKEPGKAARKAPGKAASAATKKRTAKGAAAPPEAVSGRAVSGSQRVTSGDRSTTFQEPPSAAGPAAEGATMAKPAETRTAGRRPVAPKTKRTAAETEKIRVALAARRDELREEYDQTMSELADLQRDRLTDSAGDDQADTGTKTLEREQEISLANGILERINQVERALERLDDGRYGWCERCGNPIPVERLAAFPSATLCVTCKQMEERR